MSLDALSQLDGDQYRKTPIVAQYPPNLRRFYAPVDDVAKVLRTVISSATQSLCIAMFGYADPDLDRIIRTKLESEHIFVQITLDSTQAAGKGETAILAKWQNDGIGNSIAIGQSEKHAIQHMKLCIVDGIDVIDGSTNWSASGENRQANQLTVTRDAVVAAEARVRLDILHDAILKQMAAKTKG